MKWLGGITDSMDMSLSQFREMMKDREAWYTAVHEVIKSQTLPSNCTALTIGGSNDILSCFMFRKYLFNR